jgi:glyoxylase-like metal-dependent hydrolase (beta-lactamase superfamily II)
VSADRPTIIDTKMHGHPGITAAYLIHGDQTALVETGPKSVVENVFSGLEAAGVDRLDWIVVTHIHLDHAGAAGTLAQRFPEAKIAVHKVGAPHLVDPSKLWSSATRIYGDKMDQMWGGIDPIPEDRIHLLSDGDEIDLGGRKLTAIETPGHAGHHHALLDDRTGIVFTGDALGVRLPEVGVIRPATPPPEFHLEEAKSSIRLLRDAGASALWPTHFGPIDEGANVKSIAETCEEAIAALDRWAEWVRAARTETDDLDAATAIVQDKARSALEDTLPPDGVERMEQTTSYRMNTSGYLRYFDKHEA